MSLYLIRLIIWPSQQCILNPCHCQLRWKGSGWWWYWWWYWRYWWWYWWCECTLTIWDDEFVHQIILMIWSFRRCLLTLVWHIISISPQYRVRISHFWLRWGRWWAWWSWWYNLWWWVSTWSFRRCILTLVWQIIRIHPLANCDDDMDDQNYHKIISGCWAGLD